MAHPSPAAIEAIRDFVEGKKYGWSRRSDQDVVDMANEPSVENPVPQTKVPRPYGPDDILGVLSEASAGRLMNFAGISGFIDAIVAMDSARILAKCTLLRLGGQITAGEQQGIRMVLEDTEPDPAWPEHVGWAQAELGRPLDLDDAAQSRPAED